MALEILNEAEQNKMRAAGKLAGEVLNFIEPYVQVGVTTGEIDKLCHDYIRKHDAFPAPLGYKGFPKSTCTSINEVICHGIPGPRKLKDGDIVNIDITVILDGFHGDSSDMFCIGNVSDEAQELVDITRKSLWLGIAEIGPQKRIGSIGAAIEQYAKKEKGCGVVTAFCGHGVGRRFHMEPQIPHVGRRGRGLRLKPGMTFTIEPMINRGLPDCDILDDGWTAVTIDSSLSAQAEHTLLVTMEGCEVLTLREGCYLPEGYQP